MFRGILATILFLGGMYGLVVIWHLPDKAFGGSYSIENDEYEPNYPVFRHIFTAVIIFLYGYSIGQAKITGFTEVWSSFVYSTWGGIFAYGLAWDFYSLSTWTHYLCYPFWLAAGLCFLYSFIFLDEHKTKTFGKWIKYSQLTDDQKQL